MHTQTHRQGILPSPRKTQDCPLCPWATKFPHTLHPSLKLHQVPQHLLLKGIHSSFFCHCNIIWFTLRFVWHDTQFTHVIFNTGNSPVSSGPRVGCSSELPYVGCGDSITVLEVTTQTWSYKWLPLQGRISSPCLLASHLTGHCYNGRQPLNESSKFKKKKYEMIWSDWWRKPEEHLPLGAWWYSQVMRACSHYSEMLLWKQEKANIKLTNN